MHVIEALTGECERISSCVLELGEDDFDRPTRCTAWNVKELLAHVYRDIEQVAVMIAEPAPAEIDTDGVGYWGMYDPVTGGRSIADRAKMRAGAHRTGHELARIWSWMWPRALDDASREPADRIIRTWGPAMLLQEFLRTRVVEAAVHGLDLADALGRDPWLTPKGASVTRAVLAGRLGGEPPQGLAWADVTFIEKGTGRAALTPEERAILGDDADRFPLLA